MESKKKHIVFEVINFIHDRKSDSYDLLPIEKLMLINLASHNGKKGICPSHSQIATELKISDRYVRTILSNLQEKGLIEETKFVGKKNEYKLCIFLPTPDLQTLDLQIRGDPQILGPRISSSGVDLIYTTNPTKKYVRSAYFDDFWKAYPRNEKKKQAQAIWTRKRLDKKATEIIADVENRKKNHVHWLNGFVPHATTYLNGERWNDQVVTNGKVAGQAKTSYKSFEEVQRDMAEQRKVKSKPSPILEEYLNKG